MDRSQYIWGYMGGTTLALGRSLGPFQPVQFHRVLAFHSPPFGHYLPIPPLTTDRVVVRVLCLRDGHARVRTYRLTMSLDGASESSGHQAWTEPREPVGVPAYPAVLRSRTVPPQAWESSPHSTPRHGPSSDLGLVALFHQIAAYRSPPFY